MIEQLPMLKKPNDHLERIFACQDDAQRTSQLLEFLNATLVTGPSINTRDHSWALLAARPAALRRLLSDPKVAEPLLVGCLTGDGFQELKLDTPLKRRAIRGLAVIAVYDLNTQSGRESFEFQSELLQNGALRGAQESSSSLHKREPYGIVLQTHATIVPEAHPWDASSN